jgi:hypothetical protein
VGLIVLDGRPTLTHRWRPLNPLNAASAAHGFLVSVPVGIGFEARTKEGDPYNEKL